MPKVLVRGRFRKWGNTYAFAVSPKDLARLKAKEGSEAEALFSTEPIRPDYTNFGVYHGSPDLSEKHDDVLRRAWKARKRE